MNSISLLELGEQLKYTIKNAYVFPIWIHAEISEFRETAAGHCYLELVEKEKHNDRITAKMKANIWASTYHIIKPYFEQETGQSLRPGLMIMVQVNVDFHEVYGISLNIRDIDPTYSLGDIARRRQEIINTLKQDGVFEMNKELPMPVVPQRIAIISSSTAAGYGDFMDQLSGNRNGYRFYCKLFPATMQGQQTEESIINAFNNIYQHIDFFDVVVIIRGGGATADLSAFDSYQLAYYCTQFPLPVITGIGHLRDETILDMVAHTSLKTPTAVAEKLISKLIEAEQFMNESQARISQYAENKIRNEHIFLKNASKEVSRLTQKRLLQAANSLNILTVVIKNTSANILSEQKQLLMDMVAEIKQQPVSLLKNKKQELSVLQKNVTLQSPDYILSKGYSITTQKGKVVCASDLKTGDEITTRFSDGTVASKITSNETNHHN